MEVNNFLFNKMYTYDETKKKRKQQHISTQPNDKIASSKSKYWNKKSDVIFYEGVSVLTYMRAQLDVVSVLSDKQYVQKGHRV